MRKIWLVILIITLINFSCKKKEPGLDQIFSEYSDLKGVSFIKLPPTLFKVYLEKYENVPEISFENVKVIRYMVVDKTETDIPNKPTMVNDINSELDLLKFEDLLRYSESGNETIVRILDNGNYISDLMILVNDNGSLMMIGISGQMKMEDITNLASKIDFTSLKGIRIN